jgi:hypothetical protein
VAASVASVQHDVGVDGSFLAWVDRRLPRDATFYVVSGGTTTSAPQSWSQFVLMPRLERYDRACAAEWIVFAGASPHVRGVALGALERYGKSDDWIAPVRDRCTR